MIEVFKTKVTSKKQAQRVARQLLQELPGLHVHFDLEDVDKVLRVETSTDYLDTQQIVSAVEQMGFGCALMED